MEFLIFLGLVLVAYQLAKINKNMDAVLDFTSAVDTLTSVAADGFGQVASALAELSSDIQRITSGTVSADEVEAQVARLVAQTDAIRTQADGFAQQIRDAIPTPLPVTPDAEPAPAEPAGSLEPSA